MIARDISVQLHIKQSMNYSSIKRSLDEVEDTAELFQAIVDTPFGDKLHATTLGLGIVVLLLADYETNSLRRIALSNTEMASGAVKYSVKPFHKIIIPLDYTDNLLVKAIATRLVQQTEDWSVLFNPDLTPEEARFNQAGAGIACSIVYPLHTDIASPPLGAMIYSYFEPLDNIGDPHHRFMTMYSSTVAEKLKSVNIGA